MIEQMPSQNTKSAAKLSVVVAVEGNGANLSDLMKSYRSVLDARGQPYEMIFAFDKRSTEIDAISQDFVADWPEFMPFPQYPWSGEDAAIKLGIYRAQGDTILVLPAWAEIDPTAIDFLVDAVGELDIVIGFRKGLEKTGLQKLRAKATHWLLRLLFQHNSNDVFCRARAGKRDVFLHCMEYGVRQHFLPVIGVSEGYSVEEVPVAIDQSENAQAVYRFNPQAHIGALADMLTLFVGLRFLKRPLRFFGAIGIPLIVVGGLLTLYLIFERLVLGAALADRPILVFSVLTFVLGIQIVALGLIGEIIIFSASRKMRSYEIDHIIRGRLSGQETADELDANDINDPP